MYINEIGDPKRRRRVPPSWAAAKGLRRKLSGPVEEEAPPVEDVVATGPKDVELPGPKIEQLRPTRAYEELPAIPEFEFGGEMVLPEDVEKVAELSEFGEYHAQDPIALRSLENAIINGLL